MALSFGRIFLGVGIVAAGGVGGYFAGKHWKHEKIGAGVGIVVGMGVNYAIMSNMAGTTNTTESPATPAP